MVNFTVTFFAIGDQGYQIGTKNFNTYASMKAAVQKAFGKTLPGGDILNAEITFNTKYRGVWSVKAKPDDYAAVLTKIQTTLTAEQITLDNLLA